MYCTHCSRKYFCTVLYVPSSGEHRSAVLQRIKNPSDSIYSRRWVREICYKIYVGFGSKNRNQDRSQCKPLCRRNSNLLTDSAAYICLYPPPQEISLSRDICLQGEGRGSGSEILYRNCRGICQ